MSGEHIERHVRTARDVQLWRSTHGQTTTEVLMILGLLTALIIAVTKIVVPTVAWVVLRIVVGRALLISSV
jgi:uncharacterized membrane protein